MKNFIYCIIFLIGLFAILPSPSAGSGSPPGQTCFVIDQPTIAPAALMQEEGGGGSLVADTGNSVSDVPAKNNFLLDNWIALLFGLLGFIELIVRLTPTQKDNSIFNWITALINALVPNIKKGGGTFKVSSN